MGNSLAHREHDDPAAAARNLWLQYRWAWAIKALNLPNPNPADYPHVPIGKVWKCHLLFVCFCLFVRLLISLPRTKLAAPNFAGRFVCVQGREFGNFASPEAQNRTNRPARLCCNAMLLGCCDSHAYQVYGACGCRIGMSGYTSVSEEGRTCCITACRGLSRLVR